MQIQTGQCKTLTAPTDFLTTYLVLSIIRKQGYNVQGNRSERLHFSKPKNHSD